jgi:hypothetical protein
MYQQEPTPCKNEVRIPGDFESQGYTLLGYVHTHPFEPGEEFNSATADACDGMVNRGDIYDRNPSPLDINAAFGLNKFFPNLRHFFFDSEGIVEFSVQSNIPKIETKEAYDNRNCI